MGTKPSPRFAFRKDEAAKGKKAVKESNQDEEEENELVPPEFEEFTGFVFKTQANLDPKHRDRLAYIRIVSGSYQKGMKVGHSRSKPSKRYNLGQAVTLFGSDRESIDIAYPGDVIGINNPGLSFFESTFAIVELIVFFVPHIPLLQLDFRELGHW